MLKLSLILSGLLSFWYFLNPGSFAGLSQAGGEVLGARSVNQAANRQTVYIALLAFCLDKQTLPKDLNELYAAELSKEKRIDLNQLFRIESKSPAICEFQLVSK
jgi:hypothetical protein